MQIYITCFWFICLVILWYMDILKSQLTIDLIILVIKRIFKNVFFYSPRDLSQYLFSWLIDKPEEIQNNFKKFLLTKLEYEKRPKIILDLLTYRTSFEI